MAQRRKILIEVLSIPIVILIVVALAVISTDTKQEEIIQKVIGLSKIIFLFGSPIFAVIGISLLIKPNNRPRGLAYMMLGLISFVYAVVRI
jgi:uncharacterized membrane protein